MAKGGRLSTKKPEQVEQQKPVFEYNDKTYKSYIKEGLGEDIPKEDNNRHERRFIAQVSDKFPIERRVTTMVRERILDPETNKLREVLTYMEDWLGKNWMGKTLPPVRSHWEGVWKKQNLEPVTDDESHNVVGYRSVEPTIMYDIAFSKVVVDNIIKKSSTTDPELIRFVIKGTGGRRGYPTYQQFVDLTWPECQDVLLSNGGFESAHIREILQRTK